MVRYTRWPICAAVIVLLLSSFAFAQTNQVDPPLPDGTAAGEAQIKTFRLPEGWKAELFAAEPQVASPIAIALDEQGRVFVAEEYRFNRGTEENRTRSFLLEDDLQIQTLEDRQRMFEKHINRFDGGIDWFRRITDRVQLLEDRDGDGRADLSTTFADGFCEPLDGLMAGVLARDGDIYVTCIPHLWRLRDNDGDGKADQREKLLSGFGVNAAFLGHDLHGLVWGPDGKLYFSVGDRGFHVKTHEGHIVSDPRRGAVFRCQPDGSELEVVYRGLRNPQELAFDELGNLFADDNNCDKGDDARLVYIVEGGDSGWNMAFQSIPEPYLVGPWHAEKMWHSELPGAAERPAWVMPPVGKIGNGPSGFLYDPGVGMPEAFRGCFLMCNFAGGNGGLEAYRVKPEGAGFKLVETLDFLKPIMATDAEFGYDGKLYISDFIDLDWSGKSKGGRIYTAYSPEIVDSAVAKEMKQLFAKGFNGSTDELLRLLAHPDMRVRQRSQFSLASRGAAVAKQLDELARSEEPRLPRLHALWALGQISRREPPWLSAVASRLLDSDLELRAAAAKILGDRGALEFADKLKPLLSDPSPRVRYFAILAMAKCKAEGTGEAILAMARENAGQDLFLQHACVQSLIVLGDAQVISKVTGNEDPNVRLIGLLAQRRRLDPDLVRFFTDQEPRLVLEAARAIHDLEIDAGTPDLAKVSERLIAEPALCSDPLVRRVVAAHGRVGEVRNLDSLLDLLAQAPISMAMHREILETLRDWQQPPPRDRVTGNWRPTPTRTIDQDSRQRLLDRFAAVLHVSQGDLGNVVASIVDRWKLPIDNDVIADWATDIKRPTSARIAALSLLVTRSKPAALDISIKNLSEAGSIAAATLQQMRALDPDQGDQVALEWLSPANEKLPDLQRQAAIAWLGLSDSPGQIAELMKWLERVEQGTAPTDVRLDVVEAASQSPNPQLKRRGETYLESLKSKPTLERFAMSLDGGDSERGKRLFRGHARGQCLRCHKTNEGGGDVGPDLSRIAEKRDATYLLESLVSPDSKIADGFGSVVLLLDDGRTLAGVIKRETDTVIELQTPQNEKYSIAKSEIEEQSPVKSTMPSMDSVLAPREIRDIIAYLKSLK
ncbi:MAG TPA: hypothetical protein DDZ51_16195 [Planctomycetaceae bacterium]|nr:hypothetical protein [Planctomycetaceae bacterium]